MDIIKHKSLNLTLEQINGILQGDIPDGIAVDKGDGFISISPEKEIVIPFKEKCKAEGISQASIFKKAIEEHLEKND